MSAKNSKNLTSSMSKLKINKILIAVDKVGLKEKIVSYGIFLAKGSGASIIAIHVLDQSTMTEIGDVFGRRVDEYKKAMNNRAEELLAEVQEIIENEGIKVKTEVIGNKSLAQGIINYAKESGADVIVIGTKGLTGVGKFFMGSVASSVINHAHCPVVAVR
jgi:nucleotide-binding universal stress UspA family protein